MTIIIQEQHHHMRLDKAITSLVETLSREKVKKLILEGCLTQSGTPVTDPSFRVEEGMEFELSELTVAPETSLKGEDIPLDIRFEDDHMIVLNKPVGLVVHPGAGNYSGTLVNALIHHCGATLSDMGDADRPGIVHRLDKDTSGLMVVAKTDEAHRNLAAQFDDRTLSRTYLSFVEGLLSPLSGTIDKNIARSDANRKKMAAFDLKGKTAVTHYETLGTFNAGKMVVASLVECKLETGRTHQIRVHLADKGHPVLGDPLYGRHRKRAVIERLMRECEAKQWKNTRQALHAHKLELTHPITGERLEFESEMPEDLQELHEILKSGK